MANYFSDWTPQVNRITYPVPMPNDFRHPTTHPSAHPHSHHGGLHQGVVGQGYGGGPPPPPGIGGGGIVGGVGVVGLQPATALAFDPQAELLWAGDWKVGLCRKGNRGGKRLTAGIGTGGFFCEPRAPTIHGLQDSDRSDRGPSTTVSVSRKGGDCAWEEGGAYGYEERPGPVEYTA